MLLNNTERLVSRRLAKPQKITFRFSSFSCMKNTQFFVAFKVHMSALGTDFLRSQKKKNTKRLIRNKKRYFKCFCAYIININGWYLAYKGKSQLQKRDILTGKWKNKVCWTLEKVLNGSARTQTTKNHRSERKIWKLREKRKENQLSTTEF